MFVKVPSWGQIPFGINPPETFTTFETSVSQLSAAIGKAACAAAIPVVLLHSSETFKAFAAVVHVGAVLSTTVITCV